MNGYTLCEYIQSDGTQYIDTGFKPNNNTRVVMDIVSLSKGQQSPFGARTSATSKNYSMLQTTILRSDYNNVYSQKFELPQGRFVIDKNKETTTVNGVAQSYTNSSFQCDYNMYLFSLDNSGKSQLASKMKLYSCQIYDNGTLVRDYIPCMSSEGVYGLYDNVNNTFHASATDSGFIGKWAEQKCLNLTPQEFRHRLMSIGQNIPKIWIQVAKDISNTGNYRKHIQNVTTDRKIYGVALITGASYARKEWCTHIKFSTTPVNPSIYTEVDVNGKFTGKRFDESNAVIDILTYDTSYANKCTYRTRLKPTDEWSSYSDIGTLPTEELNINGIPSLNTYYTFYFENPLYLVLLQEAVDVSKFFILIDETPEPQEYPLYV